MSDKEVTQINKAISMYLKAQRFISESNLDAALEAINASMEAVTTGKALMLKATIYEIMGKNDLAREYMDQADKKNTDQLILND